MVTITAPSSNPTPTYNRSGVTIDFVYPNVSSAPGLITRTAGHTIAMVPFSTGYAGTYVQLPSNAEVGDVVEIYPMETFNSPAVNVVTLSSAITINGYFTRGVQETQPGVGFYRLLSSSNWGAIWSVIK